MCMSHIEIKNKKLKFFRTEWKYSMSKAMKHSEYSLSSKQEIPTSKIVDGDK